MLEKMSEMIAEQLNCDAAGITAETSFKDMDYPTIRVLFKRSKTARFIRSRATPATVAESMSILSVITRFLATAHLPIKIHKPPAFCRRLDYISERYCAGLKTKSLKIQT